MTEIKPCKVCNFTRQKYYGLVVVSLSQLKVKGREALGYNADASVTVVLDDDGTVVEDDAYFRCLPPNTKFMFLQDKEMWKAAKRFDGGTAWLRQSFDLSADTVDGTRGGVEPWRTLANQLKQDLASIVLMSEADLESLVAVPCAVLASATALPEQKTQDLQNTLQSVLDRREEQRQSKELLQLYLKVVEKERSQELQRGESVPDEADGPELPSAAGFNARTLQVLKSKTSPETRLSNDELQTVLKLQVELLKDKLGWDSERTAVLLQACEEELSNRLQQVQAMQSLRAHSQCGNSSISNTRPHGEPITVKRKK